MESTRAPLLLVVSGKPATGKTTLARRLAADLGLPLIAKDGVKETLFDSLGVGDRSWSRRLGAASMALLAHVTEMLLCAGQSLVIEANFVPEAAQVYQALATRYGARVAQVWLSAEPDIIAARFEQRAASVERHRGHVELANMDELRTALLTNEDAPLALDGALYSLDTTDFAAVDYDALLAALRTVVASSSAG